MYWCKSPSVKRHYFFLSVVLFILQYFWVYFAIFCSAMRKNEWKSNGLNIFGDRSNLRRSFDVDDVFIRMSDIGSNCHYFAYEPTLKYSFERNLLCKMKSCGVIVRYQHCDRKEKQFCMRHYQKVTHPSTDPIRRRLTPRTRLLDHRGVHRFANHSVRLLIHWTGHQCKPFMIHISSWVSKYNNSPTPSSLRIVSKPDTATQEYRKKVHSLQNTCNVDSCTHWLPIFFFVSGAWGLMAGLSGFASHRCSLHLGAGCQ